MFVLRKQVKHLPDIAKKFISSHKENNLIKPLSVLGKKIETKKKNKSITNLDQINNDSKLKNYIGDIYKYSGYGFGGSLAASIAFSGLSVGTLLTIPSATIPLGILWFGNVGFSFYSIYKISKIKSETTTDLTEIIPKEKKKWYTLFAVSNGITLAPVVGLSLGIHPMIFPLALSSTLGTFAGATYYALKQDNLDAIKWQAPLMGCVTGLICSGFVQIGASLAGYTQFAHGLAIATTLVSTATFTGLIVADTQQAIQDFKDKNLDSINTSLNLLLDATNLFIDFIKIFSEIMSKAKD